MNVTINGTNDGTTFKINCTGECKEFFQILLHIVWFLIFLLLLFCYYNLYKFCARLCLYYVRPEVLITPKSMFTIQGIVHFIYRIKYTQNKEDILKKKRSIYAQCWVISAIFMCCLIVFFALYYIYIFSIPVTTALYSMTAVAVVLSYLLSSMFSNYFESLKILSSRRLEYKKVYSLGTNMNIIYKNLRFERMGDCEIKWFDMDNKKPFGMEIMRLRNYDVYPHN